VFPEAQSPQFGLSQLAERRGDRAMAARAMLGTLSASPVSDADRDPWWRYSESCGADAIALLAEARSRLAAKRGMSQRTEERGL